MKRVIAVFLCVLLMCAALTACGGGTESSASTTGGQPTTGSPAAYTYVLNGVTLAVNAEMAPLVDQLGEPTSYFESESCAFQGMDKVYTYGSVVISTYPEAEVDYILSIELKDDTVSTSEGISIGDSKEDVIAVYGEATTQTDTALSYETGDCVLAFILKDGKVSGITYTADVL